MVDQQSDSRTTGDDVAWYYDAVQGVSRTFALTIDELEEPMAREICLGYLLCRIADTVEDATDIPPDEQSRILETYSRALDSEDETSIAVFHDAVQQWIPEDANADWSIVDRAPEVVAEFEGLPEASRAVMVPSIREMVDGMATFVDRYADDGGLRLQSFEELESYCWYVAGTVGEFVTELLVDDVPESDRPAFRDNARSFALLLQLVNVAKDVATDYRTEANVYVPLQLLANEGLEPADIADTTEGEAFAPIISQVVDRADQYLDGAQSWLETMPEVRGHTRPAWAIPFLLAVGTIRELESNPAAVIEDGGVKVSREEVLAIRARFTDGTDPDIAALRKQIRQAPLHRG